MDGKRFAANMRAVLAREDGWAGWKKGGTRPGAAEPKGNAPPAAAANGAAGGSNQGVKKEGGDAKEVRGKAPAVKKEGGASKAAPAAEAAAGQPKLQPCEDWQRPPLTPPLVETVAAAEARQAVTAAATAKSAAVGKARAAAKRSRDSFPDAGDAADDKRWRDHHQAIRGEKFFLPSHAHSWVDQARGDNVGALCREGRDLPTLETYSRPLLQQVGWVPFGGWGVRGRRDVAGAIQLLHEVLVCTNGSSW